MSNLLTEIGIFKPTGKSVADSDNLVVSGKLSTADALNHNKRKYPFSILKPKVQAYIDEYVAQNRALGELDHPESNVVNLRNVSHRINEIWWEGKDVFGKVEILDTPSGRILKALFDKNIPVGISSRGLGSVKPMGYDSEVMEVQDDFELICWDFVSTPSNYGSFMNKVNPNLNESINRDQIHDPELDTLFNQLICINTNVCKL